MEQKLLLRRIILALFLLYNGLVILATAMPGNICNPPEIAQLLHPCRYFMGEFFSLVGIGLLLMIAK